MNAKKEQNVKILLTISLLVSNRIDTIRKCMESLLPILEAVPSELIAVDTVEAGKSDGSIEVVREYTEKIVPFVWCNDFSAARNAGLEKAQGEWFMYIDDDEWLEDASPIIRFFETGEYRKYNCAFYTVRNYTDPEGTRWADNLPLRLFRMEKGIRFKGKIHEMVPVEDPSCALSCYAHHYGYAFKSAEDKRAHINRNKTLLLEEYERDRGNHRTAAHLIQEYEGEARFEESLKVIQESSSLSTYKQDGRYWHFLKLHEILDYLCLKDFEKAYELGTAYLTGGKLLLSVEVGVNQFMMEACDHLGKPEECMRYLETYLKLAEEIVKRRDLPYLMIMDISQCWNETNQKLAYTRGVNIAYQLGDMERTKYYIRKIDWKEKELKLLEGTVDNTFHYFEKVSYEPWMTEIMEAMLERGFSSGSIRGVLAAMGPDSMERKRILRILASCKNCSTQVSLCRAEYAVWTGDRELLCKALQELVDNPDGNLLLLEERVLRYMNDSDIVWLDYIESVPFYRWFLSAGQWDREKDLETKRKECFLWRTILPADSLYLFCVEAVLGEAQMREAMDEGKDFPTMHQSFLMMAEKTHRMNLRIYHPDAFEKKEMFTVLPPNVQFAEKYLLAAACLEKGDGKGFASLVKEAGVCDPSRGEACKQLLEKYQSQSVIESRNAQIELTLLIERLKHKAGQLWENGQKEEAAAIIKQVLQVQPDEELAEKYHITR